MKAPETMIDPQWAQQFAKEWLEAWNSHDLERILAHYADDFEMSSPFIVKNMHIESGTLKGKEAVRPYWEKRLAADPGLKFDLTEVLVGVNSIVLYYTRTGGTHVAEILTFNDQYLVIKGSAHHA